LNVSESWKKILDLPLTLCESQQVNYVGNMNSIIDGITNDFFCWWYAIIVNEITNGMVPINFFLFGVFFLSVNPSMIILLKEWPTK
jgi:hypothetical protein